MTPAFDPRLAYRNLRLIFLSLNTGLIVFFFAGIYVTGGISGFSSGIEPLTLISLLMLGSVPVGFLISSRRMEAIREKDPFATKWEQFQVAMFIRWAIVEGTALLAMVGYIVLEDAKQLVLFILTLLVFALASPTRERVIRGAKLNRDESRALEGL